MMEVAMIESTEMQTHEKKELSTKEEKTVPGKYYIPDTDIYETSDALIVVMEIPGVSNENIDIKLEKDQLTVNANIDLENYKNYKPVYTEYNVGHYSRGFTLTGKVDQDRIEASVTNGVLSLKLPKAEEAKPRKIPVN